MKRHGIRMALAAALILPGAFALAQTPPPSATDPMPQSTPQEQQNVPPAQEPSTPQTRSTQDPKLKQCMTTEKSKNSGLSDTQIKQKCMLEIGSHQGH
jgi:hypothetical protein